MPRGNQRMPGVCQVSACLPFLPRSRSPREHVIDTLRSGGSKSGRNLNSTQIPNNTLTFHFTRDACSSSPPRLHPFSHLQPQANTPQQNHVPCTPPAAQPPQAAHRKLEKRGRGRGRGWTCFTCAFDICSEFACVHCHAQRLARIPLATARAHPAVL